MILQQQVLYKIFKYKKWFDFFATFQMNSTLIVLINILAYVPLFLVNLILFLNYLLYKLFITILQLIYDLTYNRNIPIGNEDKRLNLCATVMHDAFNYHVSFVGNSHLNGMILMKLRGNLGLQELQDLVQERVLKAKDEHGRLVFQKLIQVIRYKFLLPTWMPATDFNIAEHIFEVTLDLQDPKNLQGFASKVYSEGIPLDRPMWRFYIIQDVNEHSNESYILMVGHHCAADGFSFLKLWIQFLSDPTTQVESSLMTDQTKLPFSGSMNSLYKLISVSIATLFVTPVYLVDQILRFDSKHRLFKYSANGNKLLTWEMNFDFEKIRFIKNQTKTTVNDVFMAILTSSLEKYSQMKDKTDEKDTYVGMGIAKTTDFKSVTLSNDNNLALDVKLPLASKGFAQQLQCVHSEMSKVKGSLYPFVLENTVMQLTALPVPLMLKLPIMATTGSTVGNYANLPGPKNHLFLKGKQIDKVTIFVPQSNNQTMGVCFFTYAGKLSIGLHVDTANFPEANELLEVIKTTMDEVFIDFQSSISI